LIRFVVSSGHDYTVKSLVKGTFGVPLPTCSALSYDALFQAPKLAPATYVFCDLERLSDLELGAAAEVHRMLADSGRCRVLNDPARVLTRYALLRSLHEAGVNDFDGYRADGRPRPRRFPVFIRAEAEHAPALTDLLPDQAALDAALEGLVAGGRPLRGLIVIEYAAQPIAPGLFRRYGTFRIGSRMHLDHVVTEDSWNVKWGKLGLVGEETYKADDEDVRANRYADELSRAFDLAGIDYGRADFGLVDGRPQVYEINTNPAIGRLGDHPSPTRAATLHFSHVRFAEVLAEIDTPEGGPSVLLEPGSRHKAVRATIVRRLAKSNAEIARLSAQLAETTERLGEATARLGEAEKRVASLQSSTSWRVTTPLRALSGTVGRWRRG
jgi:hypothetical protein